LLLLGYLAIVLAADQVIPDWLESLGNELHNAWPVFLSIAVVIGTFNRWVKPAAKHSIREIVRDEIKPVAAAAANATEAAAQANASAVRLGGSIEERLDRLAEEFRPNGGSSMKDSVNRIEKSVDHLATSSNFSNARILALQANKDLALYEMDGEGNLTHINSAFVNLYRRPYEELMAGGWRKYLDPDDLERIGESGRAATEGRTPWYERFTVIREDGTRIPCVGRGYPIEGIDGEFYGFAGAIAIDDDIIVPLHPSVKVGPATVPPTV
jgi:PAS domain S-box-containing protein